MKLLDENELSMATALLRRDGLLVELAGEAKRSDHAFCALVGYAALLESLAHTYERAVAEKELAEMSSDPWPDATDWCDCENDRWTLPELARDAARN